MEEVIAQINKTFLGVEDHGFFTAMIDLKYSEATGQGAGNCNLGRSDAAAKFVTGMCRVAHCLSWEDLPGRYVIALREAGFVKGFKPLPPLGGKPFLFDSIYEEKKA